MSIALRIIIIALAGVISSAIAGPNLPTSRALVTGTQHQLAMFDKQFRYILGETFDQAGIRCGGCSDLPSPASTFTSGSLTYEFWHESKRLMQFMNAWEFVQTKEPNALFTITFDKLATVGDCASANFPPCVSAGYCATGCDTKWGIPCVACAPR
ncbi:MAG: hypothetical protein ACKVQA_18540 [Burkholderiales bacterium]